MSKLYDLLREIERRRTGAGRSEEKEGGDSFEGRHRRRPFIVCLLIFLSGLAALGGYYLFQVFFLPRTTWSPVVPPELRTKKTLSEERRLPAEKPLSVKIPESFQAPPKKPLPVKESFLGELPEKRVLLKSPVKPPSENRTAEKRPRIQKLAASLPPLSLEEKLRGILVRAEERRKAGDCRGALSLYRKYLTHKRETAVLHNYAACLLILGRLKEAELILKEILSQERDPGAQLNLILVHIRSGKWPEACQAFQGLSLQEIPSAYRDLYHKLSRLLEGRCAS